MPRLTVGSKLTVVFATFALGLLGTFGVPSYYTGRAALVDATVAGLLSEAVQKEAAFATWIAERVRELSRLSQTPHVVAAVTALANKKADQQDMEGTRRRLLSTFRLHVGSSGAFDSIRLLEPTDGMVVLSTDLRDLGTFKENRRYFIEGRVGPFVQDPFYSLAKAAPIMVIALPLETEDGRLIGVLAGEPRLSELNDIIARRSGTRRTDDAYLINSARLFVTRPRLAGGMAVLSRGNYTQTAKECLSGTSGNAIARDYRGQNVVTVYRWLFERNLCLILTVDESEALNEARRFRNAILLGGIAALLGAVLVAVVLANRLIRPVKELDAGASAVAAGDLSIKLSERRGDEFGRLARSFNAMTVALRAKDTQIKGYAEDLEKRVEARTAELRAAQDALLRKERLAALGQLTGTVAHELRNPLGAIAASVSVIQHKCAGTALGLERALERIGRNIRRCDTIITELLDFARAKGLRTEAVVLDTWLSGVLDEQHIPEGITVNCELQMGGAAVCFDPDELRRAVINVIDNARQAMTDGGGDLTVATHMNGERVEIEITDTGPGIPEDVLPRVLEPLFSTKPFGTGLGLPTVQRIMAEHGGGLEIGSEPGRGTRVVLWLPPGGGVGAEAEG